jgi:hypothetical protein
MGDALRPSSNWNTALRPNVSVLRPNANALRPNVNALRPNASKAARKDYRKACNRRSIG